MSRNQILIAIAAIVLVAVLFLLPKVVVNEDDKTDMAAGNAAGAIPEGHSADDGHGHGDEANPAVANAHMGATPEQLLELTTVRARYNKATGQQRALVAVELAEAYAAAAKYDSAGHFYEEAAKARPGERSYKKAGDSYFEAFTYAATQERASQMGTKARAMYEYVLKNNPADLDAKTNVAMTYIASPNPMQGITMLREVVSADPNNVKALFNLGLLSIQSGQYDKAAGHFERLVQVSPDHVEGNFYLAVSLAKTGKTEEAKALFNKVKGMKDDPALAASVDEYLAELNQN